MRVKTATEGKTKDVAITDVNPENYIVPSNEQHLYHCIIEVRKFDSETGKRLSIPRIQKFGKKGFENGVADALKKQGYTVTILHDPNEYVKAQAEANQVQAAEKAKADEAARKEAEEAAKAEEQKRIDAAVEKALKAQAEANQKAIDKAVADALAKTNKAAKGNEAEAKK
jgi:hypothetical protein